MNNTGSEFNIQPAVYPEANSCAAPQVSGTCVVFFCLPPPTKFYFLISVARNVSPPMPGTFSSKWNSEINQSPPRYFRRSGEFPNEHICVTELHQSSWEAVWCGPAVFLPVFVCVCVCLCVECQRKSAEAKSDDGLSAVRAFLCVFDKQALLLAH